MIRAIIKLLFFLSDPRVQQYAIFGSPWPVLIIVAGYCYIVNGKGRQWMENREPFQINGVITFFNFIQVLTNSYMAFTVLF